MTQNTSAEGACRLNHFSVLLRPWNIQRAAKSQMYESRSRAHEVKSLRVK